MASKKAVPKPDEAGVDVHFVYAGKADEKRHLYYVITDLSHNDGITIASSQLRPFYTGKKLFNRDRIGFIHPATLVDNGESVTFNKAHAVAGFWDTESDLAAWQATAKAQEIKATIEKRAKNNKLEKLLQPVRMEYRNQYGSTARAAILAEVIRIITS